MLVLCTSTLFLAFVVLFGWWFLALAGETTWLVKILIFAGAFLVSFIIMTIFMYVWSFYSEKAEREHSRRIHR